MIVTCILLPRWLFNIPGVLYEIHDVILILTIHVATNLARKDDDILSLNKSGKQELTHLMRVAVSHSLGVPRGDVRWVGRKKSNFQYRWFLLLASSLKIRGNVQGGEILFCWFWFWFYYNQCSMVFYTTSGVWNWGIVLAEFEWEQYNWILSFVFCLKRSAAILLLAGLAMLCYPLCAFLTQLFKSTI